MRYPEFLKENGTIGFVAPSFGAATEPYKSQFVRALENFEKEGYQTDLGPNVFAGDGIGISSTPENCGKELTDWYCSKKNDALISVGGGELMCEILDHVDFKKIRRAAPKWYMGYSDNTNFNFLLPTLCDTAAFYAPCVKAFSMEPRHESVQDAFDLMTGKKLSVHGYKKWEIREQEDAGLFDPYNTTETTKVIFHNWDKKPISGRFIGGCMDCLCNLIGTNFDQVKKFNARYADDGIIWFMEACDLNNFAIRRALWEMKHAGWFKNVKAFLIGRPYNYGQTLIGLDQYEAVLGALREFDVPVLMDCDLGHLPPMMPMINGGYGTVKPYGRNNIKIEFELK